MLSENLLTAGHPNLTPPGATDVEIWRYTSFAKYCALFRSQQLYFAAVSFLEDRWEGSHSLWSAAGMEGLSFFKKLNWSNMSLLKFDQAWNRWVRGWTFTNCWHVNPVESEAMWKLYADEEGSVAIQSTYATLRKVLPNHVGIGMVHYIDFWATPPSPQPFNGYPAPFIFKRRSLEHEKELRAIIQQVPLTVDGIVDLWNEEHPSGVTVSVDLGQLIKQVHVQPDAPQWLFETVADVTQRYGFQVPVTQAKDDALF